MTKGYTGKMYGIELLHPWDKNPRSLDKKEFERLKKLIQKLGIFKPFIITQDGTILGGNMRYKACMDLGIQGLVPVSIVEAETDQEKLEYALADNDRVGNYDEEKLAELVLENPEISLELFHVDLGKSISLEDVSQRFGPDPEEDEAPEVSTEEPISKLGEVYQLGRHRLMCGDATKIEDVEKLMDGQKADMVLTDPPYNTGMKEKGDSTRLSHMFNDSFTPEEFDVLLSDSFSNMYAFTKKDAVFYVCIDWRNVGLVKERLQALIPVKNVIVWDKIVHGLGSDYKFTYELIVIGKKGSPVIENRIEKEYQDIWHVQRTIGRNEDHATAKPLALLVKPIHHASKEKNIVLDLFGGSGSTLIACEQTNRTCYMMELDPRYCDVIRKRYENFTSASVEK